MIPSRKSTSVRDPLLTIVATHKLPQIEVRQGSSKLYSTDDFAVTIKSKSYDQAAISEQIMLKLDQRSILE